MRYIGNIFQRIDFIIFWSSGGNERVSEKDRDEITLITGR